MLSVYMQKMEPKQLRQQRLQERQKLEYLTVKEQ